MEWAWPGPGHGHRGRALQRTRGTSGTGGSHCGRENCYADSSEDGAPTEVPCTRYHA